MGVQDGAEFDHIVVGAGSAGCVLANRLSADGRARVLVVEAGGRDDWIWFHIPVGYLFAIGNPRADWMFRTREEPGLNGRAVNYPRGKVIGGCSSINAMIYMRGQAADYDGWRQLGLAGWGWDDVLPFFMRHEDHFAPREGVHAAGGEWRVERPRVRWDILDAVAQACAQAGIPTVDDFNTGTNEGVAYYHVNQRRGRRWSAATAFLKPALSRPNLALETGAEVARVLFEGRRAVGLEIRRGGGTIRVKARGEVILSAGAIGSPAILQRSGIGPAGLLAGLGIDTVLDAPGVGENLQDHHPLRPGYPAEGVRTLNADNRSLVKRALMGLEYALLRTGPLTMAPSQLGALTRSGPDVATPNLQFHFQPLSLDRFGDDLHPFPAFTASVCNLRPTSRGRVTIASPDPAAPPVIAPNYLATEEDRRVAVEGIRWARRIAAQPALARYRPQEFRPGPELASEEELARAAGDVGTTIFHPVGTARMGADSDTTAVLDGRLRVRGIERLRVIDASAMPRITSGNTAAPTMMIAEKGASLILQDAKG